MSDLPKIARFDLETLTIENLKEASVNPGVRAKLVGFRESLLVSRELIRQSNEQHAMRCRAQIAEFDELIARLEAVLGNGTVEP